MISEPARERAARCLGVAVADLTEERLLRLVLFAAGLMHEQFDSRSPRSITVEPVREDAA